MKKDKKYNLILGPGKKCALLVSDMQLAYTEGFYDANFRQDKEIDIIKKLIDVAHQHHIYVVQTIIAFNTNELNKPNMWIQKIPLLSKLVMGSDYVKLDPRLPFKEDKDKIIFKKNTSAFHETDLLQNLIQQEIDTIIICGCTTSGCVRATVVDGIQNGFRMLIVEDAVADRWEQSHQQSLYEMNAKYGDVIHSEKAINILRKNGS